MDTLICDECCEEFPDVEAIHVGRRVLCTECGDREQGDGETEYDDRPSASDAYDRASDLKRSLR